MATNLNLANRATFKSKTGPGLLDAYKHELFKGRKQLFYFIMVAAPFFVTLVLIFIQLLIKLFAKVDPGLPVNNGNMLQAYNLGSGSTFSFANLILFYQVGTLYNIVLVVGCALSVANEYRWNTVKMLATRQPSRVKLVLSKCLFALTLVVGVFSSAVAGWFIYGLFLKYFFSVPFEITSVDLDAIGNGLRYYGLSMLQTFILALAAIAFSFRFKSVVAGVIVYFVYNAIDNAVSAIGAGVHNSGYGSVADWVKPLLDLAKALNPFMLNSSVNRIAQVEKYNIAGGLPNQNIVLENPVWWAWVMLGIYLVGFTLLAVTIFARRDIVD